MNNGKYHTKQFKQKQAKKNDKLFGPIEKHLVICEECEKKFVWVGRKKTKAYKLAKYCSKSCANKQGPKNRKYNYHYTTICFKFHKRKCIICSESIAIHVHHYDGNHNNNHPTNLIPLCPTHHEYLKMSEAKYIIKECIDDYYNKFCRKWGCRLTG